MPDRVVTKLASLPRPVTFKEAAKAVLRVAAYARVTKCDNCGAAIQQNTGRKPQRFCCSECRNQWWNEHPDQVNRKAYYEITCQHCGKITTVYGNKHRKYCSHECYIADRFGK